MNQTTRTPPTIQLNVRLSPVLLDRLYQHCDETGQTIVQAVSLAIDELTRKGVAG